jgi:Flp pilus assembly protein TadG
MKIGVSCKPAASRNLQCGVAAIEFALIFTILFVAVYGIATFGTVFYLQQNISRAAEEGARTAVVLGQSLVSDDIRVRTAVRDSLASSLSIPLAASAISEVNTSNPTQITVTVVYPYGNTPLIPLLPLIDIFVPRNLSSRATAARSSL